MDNLTHGLVGVALGATGLGRRTPLATTTLVIAANAPDVDVLGYTQGEYFALAFRRGITHGVPAAVVLPFAVAGAVLAWDRWVRRRRDPDAPPVRPGWILLLSVLGVLTHPALDWLNVYGMRWGLPFFEGWSYGDAVFIVDPWLWLLLGGTTFLAGMGSRWFWGPLGALTTLVMLLAPVPVVARALWVAAIVALAVLRLRGRPGAQASRDRTARAGVAVALAYVLVMLGMSAAGSREVREAARAEGLAPLEVMLSPEPANPLAWEVEVVTEGGYVPGRYRWLSHPRIVLDPERRVPHLAHPDDVDRDTLERVLGAAREDRDVRHYLVWARYPYVVVRGDGEGWIVRWSDARYDGREDAGGLGGVTVRVGHP